MKQLMKNVRGYLTILALTCQLLPSWAAAAPAVGTTYIVNGSWQTENTAQPADDVKIIEPAAGGYNRYTDNPQGYSLLYPADMTPDVSLSAVRTVLSNGRTRVEIYHDNFDGTDTSANDYIQYGNRQITNGNYTVLADRTVSLGGRQVHWLEWTRPKLSRVANDQNYYLCAEIVNTASEVYTVFIKSSQPIENGQEIISSFRAFAPAGQAQNVVNPSVSAPQLNPETTAFRQKYFSPESKLEWGVFEPSAPETMSYLTKLENAVEYRFPFLIRYHGLDESVPLRGLEQAYADGRYVELTLQTAHTDNVNALLFENSPNAGVLYAILDGKYDDYFRQYAKKLKEFGHPVLFRLNNEMNGDWCWYSSYYSGKDTEIYKAAWRYVHDIFTASGVDNVLWVWNPHDVSRPDFKWNHYLMYYPGDQYVDIIGLTGYNTGTYFPGETWREFKDIYAPLYRNYTEVFAKPFMITEFGSNSVGGNKVAWLQSMFDQIRDYPNIKVAIWWNGIDYDRQGRPGRIYLLDENEKTTQVFRQRLQEYNAQLKLLPASLPGPGQPLRYPQVLPAIGSINDLLRKQAEAFAETLSKPDMNGSLDYRVELNSRNLTSLTLVEFSQPKLAAHPMTYWHSYTFNAKSGKLYKLSDLFKPGSGYETILNRKVQELIAEQNLKLLRPYTGITANQAFYLTPDSLVLYYQLYEFTPYYFGFPSFAIPYEEIAPFLSDELRPLTGS